ncbi:saccharopine dehydrogenase family protein [Pandoraea terrigena]|uniref:Saccharopine dehydrogenase n=1 Tax=Pandoraea terrigena TaxID=2508292 RepID=A0A5E4RST0_9BURK|nr:saccharopine dehydrogenase C-terminal domain-containing protein [Pandoraea terrigena]VVD66456.1 saccharopine dehydrogenase [Pandoraea terrigena]
MKKIALLGAGHIGQTIARLLHDSGDYRVTVFDRNAQAATVVRDYAHAFVELTGCDTGTLQQAVSGHDAVVNALPYTMATSAATAAVAAGCHYFDLTEDVAATHTIQQLAEGASTVLMPQCGLAPGFIAIAAHHLAATFEQVDSVKMRVGALPAFPTNSLKYNLTWSVDGLINEYCQPCEAIRDGIRLSVQPLEDLEHFSLDGVEYEAFNTSGGLGTLCETLSGRVRDLDYKSVRYPGHGALMKVLLNELRLKDDPETIKTILRRAVPSTLQDVVLIFVVVSGLRGGVLTQEVFARKIFAERNNGHSASAIQITTASAICAAVDMFFAGQLPQRGFVRQEQIALADFLANRFGQVYAHSTHIESLS